MASTFTRWNGQVAITSQGVSADLVPRLAANQRLVISSLKAVLVTSDAVVFWLFRIPAEPDVESIHTAIAAGEPVMPMRAYEAKGLVVMGGEGLSAAIQYPVGITPEVVVTAFGELETIS
jgi:hypothetical protein